MPHIRYHGSPNPHAAFWDRPHTSSITQPPMVGHAVAEAVRLGLTPADELLERATALLRFLLDRRRRSGAGLVELCHPWESGCDDSPRWDDVCTAGWSTAHWYDVKGSLMQTIERSSDGSPLANPAFAVGGVGFTALVAFNAMELAGVTDDERLRADATVLAEALAARWDPDLVTWVDDGPTAEGSGRARTIDALLPLLLAEHLPERQARQATKTLTDPGAHGATFGPTGVHRAEPTFAPSTYWRGSAWPQLTYLLALATTRSGASDGRVAQRVAARRRAGVGLGGALGPRLRSRARCRTADMEHLGGGRAGAPAGGDVGGSSRLAPGPAPPTGQHDRRVDQTGEHDEITEGDGLLHRPHR